MKTKYADGGQVDTDVTICIECHQDGTYAVGLESSGEQTEPMGGEEPGMQPAATPADALRMAAELMRSNSPQMAEQPGTAMQRGFQKAMPRGAM